MKDIDQKDTPDVAGGFVPEPGAGDGCFPWPKDPLEPEYPQNPFGPETDPYEKRT